MWRLTPSDAVPIERELGRLKVWRWTEGLVEPGPEVTVGEQVEAQHGEQIRQSPAEGRTKLEVAKDEDGDQSGPDLDVKSIGRGPHEGLDSQVLLDRFEERLDLPPLFVDGGDRGRCELEVIGEELVDPSILGAILDQAEKW